MKPSVNGLLHRLSEWLLCLATGLYSVSFYLQLQIVGSGLAQQGWRTAGYLTFFASWLCLLIWFVRLEKPRADGAKVEFAWKTALIPFVLLMLAVLDVGLTPS